MYSLELNVLSDQYKLESSESALLPGRPKAHVMKYTFYYLQTLNTNRYIPTQHPSSQDNHGEVTPAFETRSNLVPFSIQECCWPSVEAHGQVLMPTSNASFLSSGYRHVGEAGETKTCC